MVTKTAEAMHGSTCVMCSAVHEFDPTRPWNRVMWQTQHFVVVPSIGSLVEGWLLIVPRQHYLSMAALPPLLEAELERLKAEVKHWLICNYGSAYFFEHGPSSENTSTGCGVDHAHLHATPVVGDLLESAKAFLPAGAKFVSGNLADARSVLEHGFSYLYFQSDNDRSYISSSLQFSSQTFRKATASLLNLGDMWDWKLFPCTDNVNLTLSRFDSHVAVRESDRA